MYFFYIPWEMTEKINSYKNKKEISKSTLKK